MSVWDVVMGCVQEVGWKKKGWLVEDVAWMLDEGKFGMGCWVRWDVEEGSVNR